MIVFGGVRRRSKMLAAETKSEAIKKLSEADLAEICAPLERQIEDLRAENHELRTKLAFSGPWIS